MSDSETVDATKKRVLDPSEELEIDLNQSAPLSKKQKRLIRQGKLDPAKLEAKNPKPKPATEDGKEDGEDSTDGEKVKKERAPRIGVWVGNLSFDTSKDDLIRFITNKTVDFKEYSDELDVDEPCQINEPDFLRFNLPVQAQSKKIKGFAYIDFPSKNHQLACIKLSEQNLNGRNLLIKSSDSFEGRPSKEEAQLSKNPPSRILFVGNLSFDTTNEMLTRHFSHCGDIIKIRMATFEDTGKCKGFAFIDFKDEEGPTKALKDKSTRKLLQRNLRLEYGEDRSKRTPKNLQKRPEQSSHEEKPYEQRPEPTSQPEPVYRERSSQPKPKKTFVQKEHKQSRPKSSVALAGAQRQSAALVKSTGKKISFE